MEFLMAEGASTSKPMTAPIASVTNKTSDNEPVTFQAKKEIVTVIVFCKAKMTATTAISNAKIKYTVAMFTSADLGNVCDLILLRLGFRWDWQRNHKSLEAEFFDIIAHSLIIEPDLLGDVEDRVLTFEAHHDLFDGTVERP